tara:strand:- start:1460 stop:2701 length:1242 start_codon:yes stop_codon:yes gene_type:complete
MGNPFKKIFDKLGDALIPKELAPFIGPLTSMFAPQLGLPAALIGGQLASAKMHGGSLDPFQALAATGSYYGGGGQEIRARGENLTQRLGAGLGSAFNQPAGTTGGGFNRFTKGFSKGAGKVESFNTMDRILGSSYNTDKYDNFLFKESKLKNKTAEIDKKLAEGTITQAQYDLSLDAIYSKNPDLVDLKDPRGFMTKAGDIFKKGSEGFMPGFAERDADGNIIPGSFDFKNFMKTTATVTSLTQLKTIAEELKKANMKSKEEEGAVYRRYFQQYEDSLPLDADGNKQTYISHSGEYADPIMVKKYREYMAKGGIIGYSNGGMTRRHYNQGGLGSIPQTPTVPEGMQLDGRGGGFIPMGAQEKKDDVPAMLAKNEFVLTADAMRGFDKANGGDGNPRDAAAKMYEIMSNYEAMA